MYSISFPRKVYDYFVKHILLHFLVATLPAIYFLILTFAGKKFGLMDTNGDLTTIGSWFFWIFISVSIIFSLLKAFCDKYNDIIKNDGQFILKELMHSSNKVTQKKYYRFKDFIEHNNDELETTPFNTITQPEKQIQDLLENLRNTFSRIFDIDSDKFAVSLYYKIKNNDNWEKLVEINTENDLKKEQVILNENSSARQIIDKKTDCVFFPDKTVGILKNQYISGPRDEDTNNVGSIICRHISVENGSVFIESILSITTYGVQICKEKDTDAKNKVLSVLLRPFEIRLRLELALYYIKNFMVSQ